MHTHDPYAAFRIAPFRWAFMAHVLMITGWQMQTTAVGWLLYDRTGSAAVLGLSGLAVFLPVLLLSLPVGHWVDVRSRRAMLVLGLVFHLVSAVLLAVSAMLRVPIPVLFGTLVLSGIGNAFVSVARPVIMREAIPPHHAENGANWSSFGRRIASILGPIIAGMTIAFTAGAAHAFLIASLFYVAALIACMRITLAHSTRSREPMTRASLTEGIHFIRRTPLILSATLLDMLAVLFAGAVGLLPIYARDILHVGATGLGLLRAAPSIGSGVMSFVLAHRPPLRKAGRSLLMAVALYGVCTIIFGMSTWPVLSFAALLLVGASDAVSVTVRSTILQVFVPQSLRGRVYGVNMVFVYSSNELGDFESGIVASLIGAQGSVVLGGCGAIVLAAVFGWKWKELRELGRLRVHEDAV